MLFEVLVGIAVGTFCFFIYLGKQSDSKIHDTEVHLDTSLYQRLVKGRIDDIQTTLKGRDDDIQAALKEVREANAKYDGLWRSIIVFLCTIRNMFSPGN